MDQVKKASLLSLVCVIIWSGVLFGVLFYFSMSALNVLSQQTTPIIEKGLKGASEETLVIQQMDALINGIKTHLNTFLAAFIGCISLMLWLMVRLCIGIAGRKQNDISKQSRKKGASSKVETSKEKPGLTKEERKTMEKLHSLHLLTLFQREGRLIDFFEEDLQSYDDEQIGATVRNIHQNCKKVIKKHLNPKPVLDQQEGESITIQAGFNPSEIKLIGNVSGDPPFKGVLRHRGWRLTKFELPSLSLKRNPEIISPAEVEIT